MVKAAPYSAIRDLFTALDIQSERDLPLKVLITPGHIDILTIACDRVTGERITITDEDGDVILGTHHYRLPISES